MRGKVWLVIGVVVGIAVGVGKMPYFAGAATSLAETALRVVNTGALTIVHGAAKDGAPRRVVEGVAAVLAVLVPGITALLLVVAARATLHLRAIIGVLLAALGIAAFFYLPDTKALGAAVLAFAAAGIIVAVSGLLVAAPLAALAALIGSEFLPKLLASRSSLPSVPVGELHEALFSSVGAPLWLGVIMLVLAAVPFAVSARLVLR